jgi:hypothetical protein
MIHLSAPVFDYESDWLSWRVEYSEGGLPYLHLDGMRLCAYGSGEKAPCDQVGGGTGNSGVWYDPCAEEWVPMPNEGILIVVGEPEGYDSLPRGIKLFLLQKGDDTWAYRLSEP